MSNAIFDFRGYSIKKFIYTKEEIPEEIKLSFEDGLHFSGNQAFTEDNLKGKLTLEIKLVSPESDAYLSLEVEGYFDLNDSLFIDYDTNEKREISEVQRIFLQNGTSIMYPYLRSIVTVITSLDDESGIILPVIDLRKFAISDEK